MLLPGGGQSGTDARITRGCRSRRKDSRRRHSRSAGAGRQRRRERGPRQEAGLDDLLRGDPTEQADAGRLRRGEAANDARADPSADDPGSRGLRGAAAATVAAGALRARDRRLHDPAPGRDHLRADRQVPRARPGPRPATGTGTAAPAVAGRAPESRAHSRSARQPGAAASPAAAAAAATRWTATADSASIAATPFAAPIIHNARTTSPGTTSPRTFVGSSAVTSSAAASATGGRASTTGTPEHQVHLQHRRCVRSSCWSVYRFGRSVERAARHVLPPGSSKECPSSRTAGANLAALPNRVGAAFGRNVPSVIHPGHPGPQLSYGQKSASDAQAPVNPLLPGGFQSQLNAAFGLNGALSSPLNSRPVYNDHLLPPGGVGSPLRSGPIIQRLSRDMEDQIKQQQQSEAASATSSVDDASKTKQQLSPADMIGKMMKNNPPSVLSDVGGEKARVARYLYANNQLDDEE
uniref:Uncharacterized protein n=1 Tax=Trichogramma kaykai TaxID=54128 RepID=A0ABD2WM43_9HYME